MPRGSASGPPSATTGELDLAREREAATREVLDLISLSRDDTGPVFDAILRKSAELCGASMADLEIISQDRSHAVMVAHWGDVLRHHVVGATTWSMESELAKAIYAGQGQFVHVHDLADTDLYRSGDPGRVADVDKEGIRTFLAVPLFSGGRTVGCITLYRREVSPFTADQIALVETFAAQAVIAIENVRQFRELQERLERERAAADILELISKSRNDDRPVFDLIAQCAARLCGAAVCTFWRVEDGLVHYCASHGLFGDGLAETEQTPSEPLADNTATGRVFRTRAVTRIEDATEESYADHKWVRARGLKQLIGVPIFVGDDVWGCISLMWPADRAPREEDIQLVETFAAQAAIAIENVRQFRELQARLQREAATRNILRVISESPDDEQPTFEAILDSVTRLCGTPYASLVLGRKGDASQRMVAHRGAMAETLAFFRDGRVPMDPEDSIGARAILEGRTIHVPDMADTEQYRAGHARFRMVVDGQGLRTNLFVPLLASDGGIGCFILWKKEVAPFTADQITLMETFASHAVIAIENVRQFRELQERLEREAATRNILRVISESPDDEQPTFEAILDSATRLCGTQYASIVLGRSGDASQRMVAHRGSTAETLALYGEGRVPMEPEDSIAARAILEGRTIHVPDMAETDQYRAGHERFQMLVDRQGLRTNLFVPLLTSDGGIGCFILWKKEAAPFTADQITLMETFASHAVIAIENVRQFRALEALNAELGTRVQEQVGEIERMGRLKRFLPSAVANAVVTSGSEKMLSSHRALLGVLFCDIRGFTAFCETAEPEETIEILQTYHEEMGKLIDAHGAGVDHRMGDGIMVLFNDPLFCDDPAGEAVRLAIAMRARMAELGIQWKRLGHRLGFGVGISLGYATVGMVGFEGRFDYTASGTAINLASRLCDEAIDGEILLSPRASIAVEARFAVESRGEIALKGIREPVEVFRLA